MTGYRYETDSLGKVAVKKDAMWGAQTERSRMNFHIGSDLMPEGIIQAYSFVKEACAITNHKEGKLSQIQLDGIRDACFAIRDGKLDHAFPLHVWQTGSGTQTNMNLNEVIANYANEKLGYERGSKHPIHPNDHVNCSQSSNDTFPTAMHISFVIELDKNLTPSLNRLEKILAHKSEDFKDIIKIGRTHLQDAVPLTLGQEFSGYKSQISAHIKDIDNARSSLLSLALGATAVGTGLNASKTFPQATAAIIAQLTGKAFRSASNKFQALSAHTEAVKLSSALKNLAASLYKISNDIRMLSSGPRSGFGELVLPKNEPGSSIMPGKVNPTQCEALCMVAIQIMAYDHAISLAASQGQFELNVNKPLIAYNILHGLQLLGDCIQSFCDHCLEGLRANEKVIEKHVENSLMLITALTPEIGYDKSAEIANYAYLNNTTLREAAKQLGSIKMEVFDQRMQPRNMI